MVSRNSKEYAIAREKVKLCEFVERGYELRGVVIAGANIGWEVEYYRLMDLSPIVCFEPLPEAAKLFREHYADCGDVMLVEAALGDVDGEIEVTITAGDGQGSSVLPTDWAPHGYVPIGKVKVPHVRFDTWARENSWDAKAFNTLSVDVQGYELQVLKGFGDLLQAFDVACVECSETPLYQGGAPASEVVDFLWWAGLERLTEIKAHDDILFGRAL